MNEKLKKTKKDLGQKEKIQAKQGGQKNQIIKEKNSNVEDGKRK